MMSMSMASKCSMKVVQPVSMSMFKSSEMSKSSNVTQTPSKAKISTTQSSTQSAVQSKASKASKASEATQAIQATQTSS